MPAEVILHNAKIATNAAPSFVQAIAISDGKVTAVGGNEEVLRLRGPATRRYRRPRAHRYSRTQRFAYASDPRRAQLQP